MQKALFLKQSSEIQLTSRILFVCSLSIQIYLSIQYIQHVEYYYIFFLPILSYITIFFINSFLTNLICILIPPGWLHGNSEYCSNMPIKVMSTYRYPSLTVLIPVYKESFETTIKPTLENALIACSNYTQTTAAIANIFVCDDGLLMLDENEKIARLEFYKQNKIGWSIRPVHGRRGKFKKAGNLNYALNRRNTIGEVILLLDSDSRIPSNLENALREFADAKLGVLQMKTSTLFSEKPCFWESCIGHFTNNIFHISFRILCAFGEPSPLVGHNVFIRRSALQNCAEYDDTMLPDLEEITEQIAISCNNTINDTLHNLNKHYGFQYFSEKHVSEDFEFSMRLQNAGFKCRYATYLNGFEEGVTFSSLDEIIRLQKYAYGVNELIVHPLRGWWRHGIFCSTFKTYILSSNISIVSKYNIIGYMGMYYALAFAPVAVTLNYFMYHYFPTWSIQIASIDVLYACVLTFGILTPATILIVKKKMGISYSIYREFIYSFVFGFFFSGIGFYIFLAILYHFLNIPISWTTTNKNAISRKEKIQSIWTVCKFGLFWGFLQLCILVFGWIFLNLREWQGIVPLAISGVSHLIVPFVGIF